MRDLPAAGDVAAMPLSDGAWGACQVTAVTGSDFVVAALAWHSEAPPTLPELAGVGPLILDHHAHPGRPAHANVLREWPLPPDFRWLGNLPVPAELTGTPNSSTGWSMGHQVVLQHRWDHDLPESAKRAYKQTPRGEVEVDFGAGPVALLTARGRLDFAADVPLPADGQVRWSALDQLPQCTQLIWSGADRGLIAALTERPMISDLIWRDPPATLDLTRTGLTTLTVSGSVAELRLPRWLRQLNLSTPESVGRVVVADGGRWLDLHLNPEGPRVTIPPGLEALRDLTIRGKGTISASSLSRVPRLRTLWLSWSGAPGSLTDADALADLRHLAVLELHEAYGLAADTLPELPSLEHLSVDGLRRSALRGLQARYDGGVRLVVHGAKSDPWLAANIDNPFRNWLDDDERAGKAACRAYADTVRALAKTPPGAEAARPVLQGLVERLNAIDAKHAIIDTLRREEACDAVRDLAVRAGVPAQLADGWIDAWREF